MNNINLGAKIRALRERKGITQEKLAEAMSVSPQAVSKWELGVSYPDMPLIPMLAGYFQVSLDTLFDYDAREVKAKVEEIIKTAYGDNGQTFFREPKRFQQLIRSALVEYPDNERLICELMESYEYDYRTNGETGQLDEMYLLAQKLIDESRDFEVVNTAIEVKAVTLLAKGKYNEAKETLETLPSPYRNDTMAVRLSGLDKYNAAALAWCDHLQSLYIADFEQADAIFELDESCSLYRNYKLAKFIYERGAKTIELYIKGFDGEADSYIWEGMQTFHWTFYLGIARCCKKLGDMAGCERAVEKAYQIITTAWPDFEQERPQYLAPYNQQLEKYDLNEYKVQY